MRQLSLLPRALISKSQARKPSFFAVVYGVFLILAQWLYTAALTYGNTSLCATVYSLGFILPTLSGAVVFGEDFSFFDGVGISLAVVSLFACGINPKTATHERRGGRYFFSLLIAMIASGGLGIVQKLQQNSPVASERAPFLLIAFSLASVISLVAALLKGGSAAPLLRGKIVTGALVGVCLGACNLLNTILAGRIASAVFFPTLNIGVILLSAACGVIFFKEKFGKKELFVFIPGVLSIIVLNVL